MAAQMLDAQKLDELKNIEKMMLEREQGNRK